MKLKLGRSLWGTGLSFHDGCTRFAQARYQFIESTDFQEHEPKALRDTLARAGIEWVGMVTTHGPTVADHLDSFRKQLRRLVDAGASQITAHSGQDAWDDAQTDAFFEEAMRIEKDLPVELGHETHRGRVPYNPWTTRRILEKFQTLKLVCDFSHWVVVSERADWDDPDGSILQLCATRAIHIHARVGHTQGPQVVDPFAPECRDMLDAHARWWDTIWQTQALAGRATMTITPEFGPPPYLPTLPYTQQPLISQDAVIESMKRWVEQRYPLAKP